MPTQISESDWRQFKKVHQESLDLFRQKILDELGAVARSAEGTAHERYLRAYTLLMDRNKEMAHAFDDFRRSTAIMQLATMREMGLLTDELLSRFSEQTQQTIRGPHSPRDAEPDSTPSD